MQWYEWLFDGLGTAIISAICSFISYKAAIRKISKQSQVAGDDSKQKQKMTIESGNGEKNAQNTIRQTQRAGNGAEQIQCGEINNGR